MDINEARDLANDLMGEYLVGWGFEFDQAKRRFGVCKFRTQTIGLSAPLVRLNTREEVSNTIRHEIAHAIAGPKAGHGPLWKEACYVTGADPKRCYDSETVETPAAPYRRECSAGCGNGGPAHRKSRKLAYCGRCYRRNGSRNPLVYVPADLESRA